ncbi:hypothetical protein Tco_0732037 [Tanacetum coccineum]
MKISTIRHVVKFPTEAWIATIKSEYPVIEATLNHKKEASSKKTHWEATSHNSSNKGRQDQIPDTTCKPWAYLTGSNTPTWVTRKQKSPFKEPTSWFESQTSFNNNEPNTHLITVSSHGLLASNTISDTMLSDESTSREGLMKAIFKLTFKRGKTSKIKWYTKAERATKVQQSNDEQTQELNFTLAEKARSLPFK